LLVGVFITLIIALAGYVISAAEVAPSSPGGHERSGGSAPPAAKSQVDAIIRRALTPTRTATRRVPTPTKTAVKPTFTLTSKPTRSVVGPTATNTPSRQAAPKDLSRVVNGKRYDVYLDSATKKHQYYHYTCEFDAAWVVLKTYGIDATLEDQIAIVGLDTSIEPRYEQTENGFIVYGGDIFKAYSGDYKTNFLARSTGVVVRRIFEHYGLKVTAVNSRESMEAALRRGELVWIKTTADFKPGKPATWVMPDGATYQTVLGNDHAAVVMGYSERGALIRDVLGPTNTNWNRQYEYEVPWPKFMAAWGQQQYDGLSVARR
jgi:hypothetical protein